MSGPLLEWNRLLRALLLVESALRVCVPPAITMGRDEREGPSELLNMAVVATATHAAKTMVINFSIFTKLSRHTTKKRTARCEDFEPNLKSY
jgi:hypothetical protein